MRKIHNPEKIVRVFSILDLENHCGGSLQLPSFAHKVIRRFYSMSLPVPNQRVIAVGRRSLELCPHLPFLVPDARFLVRAGVDGADLSLCEVLRQESCAKRSKYVIVGSGDHIFAEPIEELRASGTQVIVVGRRGRIHHSLYKVANQVLTLDEEVFRSTGTPVMGPS